MSATLEGLSPDTTYHFRLVATNHCDAGEPARECMVAGPDTTFKTRTAVGIEAQWVSALSAHEATLDATLDPLGAENAFWWVEYDTSPYGEAQAAHGTRTPEAPLPPSTGELHRAAPLAGLAPATTYHYRFVARGEQDNHPYTVHGPDQTFTTQPAGLGLALPDNRAWEMVSPPDKHGARLRFPSQGQVQAAANGEALAYLSRGSVEADPEGSRSPEDTSVLGRRTGPGQWASRDLTPPNAERGAPTGSVRPRIQAVHLRSLQGAARAAQRHAAGALGLRKDPLPAPQHRLPDLHPAGQRLPARRGATLPARGRRAGRRPAGTEFGGDPMIHEGVGAVGIAGSSPDLAHVVLNSKVPLAEDAEGNPLAEPRALYEWSAADAASLAPRAAQRAAGRRSRGRRPARLRGDVGARG